MAKKYLKISVLCIGLILAVFGVKFGIDIQHSKAADVTVQLLVPNPVCGNNIKEGDAEGCDDGNTVNGDGCDSTCHVEGCGNGIRQGTEQCDDGNLVNTDACTNTCLNAICGDFYVWLGTEQCDDGNLVNTDACLNNCHLATCGDGFSQSGVEQCDDGNTSNTDACINTCLNAVCGDNFVQAGVEQCDDGNILNGDGCNSSCNIEYCGDNVTQAGLGEQCDDGNSTNGDGCDALCYTEVCGNGRVQYGEVCDDNDTDNGDGCSSACTVEPGYVCSGAILSCCSLCGDTITQCSEECDNGRQCANGNTCTVDAQCLGIGNGLCQIRSGDGCDLLCRNEGGGHTVTEVVISQITAYPELRSGSIGTNYDTKYFFKVLTSDNNNHQTLYLHPAVLSTQNSGVGYPYVTIGGVNPGVYDITFKSNAHLTSMLDNVYLVAGDNSLNFTNPANAPQILRYFARGGTNLL